MNIEGVIFLVKRQGSYLIEWKPNENVEISGAEITGDDSEWSIINQITFKPVLDSIAFLNPKFKNIKIPLTELRQLKVQGSDLLAFTTDDQHFVTFVFRRSTPASLIRALINSRLLKQSHHDRNMYLVKDPEFEKLQKSFAELNIEQIKSSKGSQRTFLPALGFDIISKLATVPNNVLGVYRDRTQDRPGAFRFDTSSDTVTSDNVSSELCNKAEENAFEKREILKLEDPLPIRELFKRENSLTIKQWQEFRTEDGRISDPDRIKEIVFRGGVEQSIRAEVWKYLLNYDIWEHTTQQREERHQSLHDEYYRMKLQWTSLSNIQEKNFSGYRDRRCQIEKDVKRTDRNMDFYTGDNNPNVDRLQEILLTYVMYNFDIGYVQGMSDLLSPILSLIDDEAASFWCFVGFMEKVFRNFDEDQAGMKNQLEKMRTLMEFANPRLFRYFKEHDSDNMYFCFRWLLVWYKREFSNDDILMLWEVLWTNLPCINFHLLIGIAILDNEMTTFIENEYGFTEILKHVNDLSEKMDLKQILETAESIYHQIINSNKLPDRVRIILGMEPVDVYGDDPYDDDSADEENQIMREKKIKAEEADEQMTIDRNCEVGLEQNYF